MSERVGKGGSRPRQIRSRSTKTDQKHKSKDNRRVDKTKIVHEAGCVISDRKTSWQNRAKEAHKREEHVSVIAEDVKSKMKTDSVVTIDRTDSLREWRQICDELEV